LSLYSATGSRTTVLDELDVRKIITDVLDNFGKLRSVLAIPPDYSRRESFAGQITTILWDYYSDSITSILPATGTHSPMSEYQIKDMFAGIPHDRFLVHNWRSDCINVGTIEDSFVSQVTDGLYNETWEAEINRSIVTGNHDLVISIGQVVPHEVAGMANHSKNIFIGTGGTNSINKSHYFSALYGIENILGRTDTPLRRLLNEAFTRFCKDLKILYILTVVEPVPGSKNLIRGLFIGDDIECFEAAAELSSEVNITSLKNAPDTIIVNLDQHLYKSTWIGNKAIYRTRMAIKEDGDLFIVAPGIEKFGEDQEIDKLIRKYGYLPRKIVPGLVEENHDLGENLAVAAHLMHGYSEGKFNIHYCTEKLSKDEIVSVGYQYMDINTLDRKYNLDKLDPGSNFTSEGKQVYYIDNPGLGLWKFDSETN